MPSSQASTAAAAARCAAARHFGILVTGPAAPLPTPWLMPDLLFRSENARDWLRAWQEKQASSKPRITWQSPHPHVTTLLVLLDAVWCCEDALPAAWCGTPMAILQTVVSATRYPVTQRQAQLCAAWAAHTLPRRGLALSWSYMEEATLQLLHLQHATTACGIARASSLQQAVVATWSMRHDGEAPHRLFVPSSVLANSHVQRRVRCAAAGGLPLRVSVNATISPRFRMYDIRMLLWRGRDQVVLPLKPLRGAWGTAAGRVVGLASGELMAVVLLRSETDASSMFVQVH